MHEPSENHITVRIVFDGAPFAGKTTAARALADGFNQTMLTPSEEGGRTAWFDWVTYTGGRHDGRPIRVELVTVPGQEHLHHRRRHLIEWGDVVVFVADSQPATFAASAEKLRTLRRDLDGFGGRPVIVLVNKRDLPDALSMDHIADVFGLPVDELSEGVATTGAGIRQAFIKAVRAALLERPIHDDETSADELLAGMMAEADQHDHDADADTDADADADADQPGEGDHVINLARLETVGAESADDAAERQPSESPVSTVVGEHTEPSSDPGSDDGVRLRSEEWRLLAALLSDPDRTGGPQAELARRLTDRGVLTLPAGPELPELPELPFGDQIRPLEAEVEVETEADVHTEIEPELEVIAPTMPPMEAAELDSRADSREGEQRRYRALRELRRNLKAVGR